LIYFLIKFSKYNYYRKHPERGRGCVGCIPEKTGDSVLAIRVLRPRAAVLDRLAVHWPAASWALAEWRRIVHILVAGVGV